MTLLSKALQAFVDSYHACGNLVAEQEGWTCGICLKAWDTSEAIYMLVEKGRVVHIGTAGFSCSLVIRSGETVLLDILEFRQDPNEPYLLGKLTIQGSEEDFMRLDYILTRLCFNEYSDKK